MNQNIDGLLKALHSAGQTACTRDQLIEALHLFSTPHSLEGIVKVARHFFELAERHSELLTDFDEGISDRLTILRAISALNNAPVQFARSSQRPDSPTPIYGYTGDGPVCDLLLILPETQAQDEAFNRLVAWFVWQALRFTRQTLPLAQYRAYLDSVTGEGRPCLSKSGARLAQAFRAIRRLAAKENADALREYLQLDLSMDHPASRRLSTLLRIAQLKSTPDHLASDWASELGLSETEYRTQLQLARDVVDPSIRILLTALWEPVFDPQRTGGNDNRSQRIRREGSRLSVRRYGIHDVLAEPVSVGGVSDGMASQIFLPTQRRATDYCDDAPETPPDPAVQLFIAEQGDFVRASYSARGLTAAIEYENACLPFRRSRLSSTALDCVIHLTVPHSGDAPEQLGGRMLLALSLISGRSLRAAKSWRIQSATCVEEAGSLPDAVQAGHSTLTVVRDQMRLLARAGSPDVKEKVPEAMQAYLSPHSDFIALTLPSRFRELITSCEAAGVLDGRTREIYLKEARKLLRAAPEHLAVTEKGVREALHTAIQHLTGDDVGMLKVITDTGDLNANNIIHYASYPTEQAEWVWHQAVARVIGEPVDEVPFIPSDWGSSTHVGTYHRFKTDEINRTFGELRQRFERHLSDGNHQRAFNVFTLYTILWLNLATCTRGRLNPAPAVIAGGRWALILDKSRADGSTDRIVPLTDAVMAQLQSYFDFVWHLSFTEPRLRPLFENHAEGTLRFQWYRHDGKLVHFQPKHLEGAFAALIRLPGNWARKLVRAEAAGELPGRFIDAGLGHWARGRNPWRLTSTMPSQRFAHAWTAMQSDLEHRLGLTVIRHPDIPAGTVQWPVTGIRTPRSGPPAPSVEQNCRDFDSELKSWDKPLVESLQFAVDSGEKEPALVKELATQYLTSQGIDSQPALESLADQLCAYLRKRYKVPIFRALPPPVLGRDWMIDRSGLFNLAHLERRFLPAFRADLAKLPSIEATQTGHLVEFGRLIMVLVWRLSLHSKPALDAFLKNYVRKPILGTGDVRYVEVQVPGSRQHEMTRRTVLLDDFCRCYLSLNRQVLVRIINEQWSERTQSRRNRWDRAVNAYIDVLGMQALGRGCVQLMIDAANQHLMLDSTPSLAAYASGAWVTNDLDDQELRRQAGLAPRRGCQAELLTGAMDASEQGVRRDATQAADALPLSQDPIRNLTTSKPRHYNAVQSKVQQFKPDDAVEALLQRYAQWLLARDDVAGYHTDPELRAKHKGRIPRRVMRTFAERVQVVGYSLKAFCDGSESRNRIDEAVLDALFELSREYMPEANHVGAWFHFVTWLKSDDCPAESCGFEVGRLGHHADRNVSAKILTAGTLDALLHRLGSAKSGIGNPETRTLARNLVAMVDAYGMRRSESEMLRVQDLQGDVLRLQAYDDKTVKTAWSERVLPIELAGDNLRRDWTGKIDSEAGQLIGLGKRHVAGFNYFDPVNKAVQAFNGDNALRLHHFRHTRITALTLSMLADAVDYDAIHEELPWVDNLLVPQDQVDVLVGSGGNAGHGLQAVSALAGHSHPTTSLGHYCHGMALSLHAYHQRSNLIDLRRSFESRVPLSTMQGWVTEATRGCADMKPAEGTDHVNRLLIQQIETRWRDEIHLDTTPLPAATETDPGDVAPDEAGEGTPASGFDFDYLERIDRNLRGEADDLAVADLDRLRDGLGTLSRITSGKRGANLPRHEMEILESGQPVPLRLPARTPTACAGLLCAWLDQLGAHNPADLDWLLRQYAFFSRRRDGCMRVNGASDQKRFEQIPTTACVCIDLVRESGRLHARIRCLDDDGERYHRDHTAVRWAMQYAFAALRSG